VFLYNLKDFWLFHKSCRGFSFWKDFIDVYSQRGSETTAILILLNGVRGGGWKWLEKNKRIKRQI